MISKPDLNGKGLSHPARYSEAVLDAFRRELPERWFPYVLDPFGGTGLIANLKPTGIQVSVELEREWAELTPEVAAAATVQANALHLPFADGSFDAIATSPCYGNRLADSHDAKDGSVRRSYTHDLGRKLHEDNAGAMQWGDAYREFHVKAWTEAVRVLNTDGRFLLNIKDHIRNKQRQRVTDFHRDVLRMLGLKERHFRVIDAKHLRQGQNRDRCEEVVITFDA
jgi:SAM-dependent methyltransferase